MPRQRGNNEGTIWFAQDKQLWRGAVTLPNGSRRTFHARSKREASDKLAELLTTVAKGGTVPDASYTVEQYLAVWLDEVAAPTLRPSSLTSYQLCVDRLSPYIGRARLARLTPQQVQRSMAELAATGLSARTVNYCRAVLRRALNTALKWGLVARNVASLAEPAKERRHEIRPWSREEEQQFLDFCLQRAPRLYPMFLMAATLGLRAGELLALRWEDLDLDAGRLTVRHTLQRQGAEFYLAQPKSARGLRTLPLLPDTVAVLRQHKAAQAAERLRAGERWQDNDLVLPAENGAPTHITTPNHTLAKLAQECGLRHIRFHDLRHGCATRLLEAGVPARVVADILGHANITLTLQTYSHVSQQLITEALESASRLRRSSGSNVGLSPTVAPSLHP